VSVSLDQNLRVHPLSEYAKFLEAQEKYSELDKETRRLQALMTGLATQEKVDGAGRIRLSPELRDIAHLKREVTCLGRTRSFEIWDRESWNETQASSLRDMEYLIEQVRRKQGAS
jgi:MraZ protein